MLLKHRDRELLHFEWVKPFGVRGVELNAREIPYLPLELRETAKGGATRELVWKLEDWLLHRTAPMNRHFVRDMMLSLGFNPGDPRYLCRLIKHCKGLSLNDVHWVVPDGFSGTWRECNLYQNDFSEFVASLAFSGMGGARPKDVSTSPEYTTNGVLAKCWRRKDGQICLFKAGSDGGAGNETYAEFYAAQVADALNVNHVDYRLCRYKGRICSVCPSFTSERWGYVPAGKLMTHEEIATDGRFADIFLLDAVIMNDDRHLGNFGFLIDNDTNEIAGVAPVFDNGHSFFSRKPERFSEGHPALYDRWEDFPGLDRAYAAERLSRLRGFRLKKDRRFNVTGFAFKAASEFLATRVDCLLEMYSGRSKSGLVKVAFTGPGRLLEVVRTNPGLRKKQLSGLTGLTERTVKRYLSQLKDRIVFKGPPKTGGYYAVSC